MQWGNIKSVQERDRNQNKKIQSRMPSARRPRAEGQGNAWMQEEKGEVGRMTILGTILLPSNPLVNFRDGSETPWTIGRDVTSLPSAHYPIVVFFVLIYRSCHHPCTRARRGLCRWRDTRLTGIGG